MNAAVRHVAVAIVMALPVPLAAQGAESEGVRARLPSSHAEARYTLTPTQNIWTFLLLDSSNGRVWQIHYSVSDSAFSGRVPISETALVPQTAARNGRFVLAETQNIWTFLLLDQEDGRVWQLQWSNDEKSRGIARVLSP